MSSIQGFTLEQAIRFENPPWDQKCLPESSYLEGTEIASFPMRDYLTSKGHKAVFNGEVYLKLLQTGSDQQTKVAFKVYRDDGELDFLECAHAESFASRVNQYLFERTGESYIPPTVVRGFLDEEQEVFGSCSYFVETDGDLWNDDHRKQAMSELEPTDRANATALAYFLSQWDLHPGNYFLPKKEGDEARTAVLIDTEGLANYSEGKYGERPWVSVAYGEKVKGSGEVDVKESGTFEDFQSEIVSYGFDIRSAHLKNIYTNIFQRGNEQPKKVRIGNHRLMSCFHQGNTKAFPIYTSTLPEKTASAYAAITLENLVEMGSELITSNPDKYDPRGSGVMLKNMISRRDEMLSKINHDQES